MSTGDGTPRVRSQGRCSRSLTRRAVVDSGTWSSDAGMRPDAGNGNVRRGESGVSARPSPLRTPEIRTLRASSRGIRASDQLAVASDLADVEAKAGVDSTLDGRTLREAPRRTIATRRGSCSWTIDHASELVTLHVPENYPRHGTGRGARLVPSVTHGAGAGRGHLPLDANINPVRIQDKLTVVQ
jgi:hypothetical protein